VDKSVKVPEKPAAAADQRKPDKDAMRTKTPPPAEEEDPYDNDDWDMPEDSPAKKNDEQAAKRGPHEKDMWLENDKQDDFIDEIPSIPVQTTTVDAVSKPKETDFNKLVGGEK